MIALSEFLHHYHPQGYSYLQGSKGKFIIFAPIKLSIFAAKIVIQMLRILIMYVRYKTIYVLNVQLNTFEADVMRYLTAVQFPFGLPQVNKMYLCKQYQRICFFYVTHIGHNSQSCNIFFNRTVFLNYSNRKKEEKRENKKGDKTSKRKTKYKQIKLLLTQ